jgi:DNA-binding MarR family transcriptional regulator
MEQHLKPGILIKFIDNAVKKNCNSMLKEMNLTSTQLDVLMYLLSSQDREVNQTDIEREFKIKNPTVTGILNRLEAKGFVRRAVSSSDARVKRILVTGKSREIEKKVHQKGALIEDGLLRGFTKEEQEQLSAFLKRVLDNVFD